MIETYIAEQDIHTRIKTSTHLTPEERTYYESRMGLMKLGARGKEIFTENLRTSEYRQKRYGAKYDLIRSKKEKTCKESTLVVMPPQQQD